jgi:ferrous iron transport protein B
VRIALIGQPNSGKSTLFNAVVGYRSLTSNFAGTTVKYARGRAHIGNELVDIFDLPGLYSLTPTNPAEVSSREYLLSGEWDVLVNVLDASQLARSLELTLELRDLEAPLVVCLNMMDEAARKGIVIDTRALSIALNLPVVEAVAARGRGILETFREAISASKQPHSRGPYLFSYTHEIETAVQELAETLLDGGASSAEHGRNETLTTTPESFAQEAAPSSLAVAGPSTESPPAVFPPPRFQALYLLQCAPELVDQINPKCAAAVRNTQQAIMDHYGQPADVIISSARHAVCLNLFETVAQVQRPRADWREQIDRLLLHPLWGYVALILAFLGFFHLVFDLGKIGETHILAVFDRFIAYLTSVMSPEGLGFSVVKGAVLGTAGAVAAVIPYLVPFLIGLAIMEDLGYLARVGYLMDAAMHRLGLHGTATLPVLLGYGCSVPAVMATRILSSRRDRFVAAFLAVLVPCSARMTVIMALAGFYLGANWALGIYALNLFVVALSGHILAKIWPEVSPGMLMEVPPYRQPSVRVVLLKTWWRLREFVVVAFPLLVAGSALLSTVEYFGWQRLVNTALSPLTHLLALPTSLGLTLIFGVLRKELSLLMLMQAMGTTHLQTVMTTAQILVFTLFVTFYLPCLATLASLVRELGWKLTAAASTALLVLAIAISLAARGFFAIFRLL